MEEFEPQSEPLSHHPEAVLIQNATVMNLPISAMNFCSDLETAVKVSY